MMLKLLYGSLVLCLFVSQAFAQDCKSKAITVLKERDPRGYQNYVDLADKNNFKVYMACDDIFSDLTKAVHEANHILTGTSHFYITRSHGKVAMPDFNEGSTLLAPRKIANHFDSSDRFSQIYLRGDASAADYFFSLLDELNAYTVENGTAMIIADLIPKDHFRSIRDGMAAMMLFVSVYADEALISDAKTWAALQTPEYITPLRILWDEAEENLAAACADVRLGVGDDVYINALYQGQNVALSQLLDRPLSEAQTCKALVRPHFTQKGTFSSAQVIIRTVVKPK